MSLPPLASVSRFSYCFVVGFGDAAAAVDDDDDEDDDDGDCRSDDRESN